MFFLQTLFVCGLTFFPLSYVSAQVPEERVTPTGIKYWFLSVPEAKIVNLKFAFQGGLGAENPEKPMTAALLAALMNRGTQNLSDEQVTRILQQKSIALSFSAGGSAGLDTFQGSLKFLAKYEKEALPLFQDILANPLLPETELNIMKPQLRGGILASLAKPEGMAASFLNYYVFEGHPYARNWHGLLARMATIQRADLLEYKSKVFRRDGLVLSLVGPFDGASADKIVDDSFGSFPIELAVESSPRFDWSLQKDKVILVQFPSQQTFVRIVQPWLTPKNSDALESRLLQFNLGVGWSSRLTKEIRVRLGYTYGINAIIEDFSAASVLNVQWSTDNSKAKASLVRTLEILEQTSTGDVSEEELVAAKSLLLGSLKLRFESLDRTAESYLNLQLRGEKIGYFTEVEKLAETSLEKINAMARSLLPARRLIFVLGSPTEDLNPDVTIDAREIFQRVQ